MADVTLKSEAFESFKVSFPRAKGLPLGSSKQAPAIHWGVASRELWIHIEMAKEILSDDNSTLLLEYPKHDQKFALTYHKGTKDAPLYGYEHILDTYVYEYIAPELDFRSKYLVLSAVFPVALDEK